MFSAFIQDVRRSSLSHLLVGTAVILSLNLAACSSGGGKTAPTASTFSTALSSTQEVPAVTVSSSGTGTASAVLEGIMLTVSGSYGGLTGPATLAHIHGPASKTESAGVMFPLTFANEATAGSGKLSGMLTLTEAQVTQLKAGQLYVNVHTAANAKGEVRGQLELK